MNLGYLTLRRLCDELKDTWIGVRVRAGIDTAGDLVLSGDNGRSLCLCASSRQSYILDRDGAAPTEHKPPPWATAHVDGAAIQAIYQVPYERIVRFDLVRRDRLGGTHETALIAELIGRRSNLFVIGMDGGKDGRILASHRAAGDPDRGPGKIYTHPSSSKRRAPLELTVETLREILLEKDDPATNLTRSVSGLDPILSLDLVAATGATTPDPSPESVTHLLYSLRRTLDNPPWAPPAIVTVGNRSEVCVVQLPHIEAANHVNYATISEAIEALAAGERSHVDKRGEARSAKKTIERRLEAIQTKIERITGDLEEAKQADALERQGNILISSLNAIPPRADSVTLPDLYGAEGAVVAIPLNPKKSAVDNAQEYMKRSGKARRTGPIAARRMAESVAERKELQEGLHALDRAMEEGTFETLRKAWVEKGWLRPQRSAKPSQKRKSPGDISPRRYLTSDGWTVLVGRSNTENDKLTKGSARDDIFFHAQGCPGSHVILKREGKSSDPGKAALEEAGALAAYWSKARGSKTVPVNYTEVRHVNKPRGAAPGLVTIRNEKTLFVSPREIRKADEAL